MNDDILEAIKEEILYALENVIITKDNIKINGEMKRRVLNRMLPNIGKFIMFYKTMKTMTDDFKDVSPLFDEFGYTVNVDTIDKQRNERCIEYMNQVHDVLTSKPE